MKCQVYAFVNCFIMVCILAVMGFSQSNYNPLVLKMDVDQVTNTKPCLKLTLINVSKEDVNIVEPGRDGMFRNLSFIIVSEDGDSIFWDLDTTFSKEINRRDDVEIRSLKKGKSIEWTIDLFSGKYDLPIDGLKNYTIQAVYQSVYRTQSHRKDNRSLVFMKDVCSNVVIVKQ